MSEHIVTSFDDELRDLAQSIAEMGGLAEQLLEDAVTALLRADTELARRTILIDRKINYLEADIEERATLIIARRQPMAQDLRAVIAAFRISNDLERVADLGKNIARRVLAIDHQSFSPKLSVGVDHLAKLGLRQIKNVLDAYGSHDVEKAHQVWEDDDEIDAVYVSLFREFLTYMMEDPRNISMCTHLLFCAKNIERVGDHATNIAEAVHYMVTGTRMEELTDQDESD